MRSTRSGAPPRLLPFRSPEMWAVRSEFFVFNILFGFLPLLIGAWSLQSCGRHAIARVIDPRDPIHRLDKFVDEEEAARGVLRVGGKLAGTTGTADTAGTEVCLVTHEYKTKEWHEDFRATFGDGVLLDVDSEDDHVVLSSFGLLPVAWSMVRWEPSVVLQTSSRPSRWRERFPAMPVGGRIREGCLHLGDRVFLDACRAPDVPVGHLGADQPAGRCGAQFAVLTPGDGTPKPRIASLAASLAGHSSLLGAAVLLLLLYGWRVAGARPVIDARVRRLQPPPRVTFSKRARTVIALAPIAFFLALLMVRLDPSYAMGISVERHGYALAYATIAAAVILGVSMWDRRRALRALCRAVQADAQASTQAGTQTGAQAGAQADAQAGAQAGAAPSPLARVGVGQAVAIEATVASDALLSAALLSGTRRAHWTISATRIYRAGRNYTSSKEPEIHGPPLVPIRSAGGEALLDLTHAVADLRALRVIARKRALRRGTYRHVLGERSVFDGLFVLEERFLDPGEAVYVEGRVQRFEGTSGEQGYRTTVGLPVIGGTSGEPVIIHAGTRRSLLSGATAERRFLDVALCLSGAVIAGVVGLAVYLVQR